MAPVIDRKAGAFLRQSSKIIMSIKTTHTNKFSKARTTAVKSQGGKTSKQARDLSPALNIDDQQAEYVVYLAVPGMERKDFSVSICHGKLMVAAAKREALHMATPCGQQAFPEWKETYTLPGDADTMMTAAVYRNGELEIHIPKGKKDSSVSPVEVFVY